MYSATKTYWIGVHLDLCITLRCNSFCKNCIILCNKKKITGLDYSDSDMTLNQIDNFIHQVKLLDKNTIGSVNVTGGEPLLHPDLEIIIDKLEELVKLNYINTLQINSNKILTPPKNLEKYIVNYSLPENNYKIHQTVLLHPIEFSKYPNQTFQGCNHYRRDTIVLTYMGYSRCCAATGYIRLFCLEELIIDYLPESLAKFPIDQMDKVCIHCPFGHDTLPLEKDAGFPVSLIYLSEGIKNRSGRQITKRFPGLNR